MDTMSSKIHPLITKVDFVGYYPTSVTKKRLKLFKKKVITRFFSNIYSLILTTIFRKQ